MLTFIHSLVTKLRKLPAPIQGHPLSFSKVWTAPTPPYVKVNFDVKYCSASSISWSGVIIRDEHGQVLGACRHKASRIQSPFAAEAMALVHAISLASDLGFFSVIFEGDSLSIIKKMNSVVQDFSIISALIWEAKGMARNLQACHFCLSHEEGINRPVLSPGNLIGFDGSFLGGRCSSLGDAFCGC
ncbi:hypothetical protein GQ457_09G011460 [Hibiscus cannabinus]